MLVLGGPGVPPVVIPSEPTGTAGGDMSSGPARGPIYSTQPVGPNQNRARAGRETALGRLRNADGTFMSHAQQRATLELQDAQRRMQDAALAVNERLQRQANRPGLGRAFTDPRGAFVPNVTRIKEAKGFGRLVQTIKELKKIGNIKDVVVTVGVGSVIAGEEPPIPAARSLPGPLSELPSAAAYVGGGGLLAGKVGAVGIILTLVGKAIQVNVSGPQSLPAGEEVAGIVARAMEREADLASLESELADAMAHLEQAEGRMIDVLAFSDP